MARPTGETRNVASMETSKLKRFNVRVYFLIERNGSVLVSDEVLAGKHCTKFPGGGLELGEGTRDCCQREAMEELGQSIRVLDHFFTTDVFVQSRFSSTDQVIPIYYRAELIAPPLFRTADVRFAFETGREREASLRWLPLCEQYAEEFSFETDRTVFKRLAQLRVFD